MQHFDLNINRDYINIFEVYFWTISADVKNISVMILALILDFLATFLEGGKLLILTSFFCHCGVADWHSQPTVCVFLYLIKFTTKYSVGGLTHNSRRCSETKEVQLLEKLLPCCVMWNFINIAKSFHFFCLYFWPNQAGTYPLIVLMLEYKDLSCFRLTALEYHRKVRQKFTD